MRTGWLRSSGWSAVLLLTASWSALAQESEKPREDGFGRSIVNIGDLDGDAAPDIAVSAPRADGTGAVFLFSGKTGKSLGRLRVPAHSELFGRSLAFAGDLDGDGKPDVFVGAKVRISELARPDDTILAYSCSSGNPIRDLSDDPKGPSLSTEFREFGDFDKDGIRDVLVASPFHDVGPLSASGIVHLVSGRTGLALATCSGPEGGEYIGLTAEPAGDVDGDGVGDIAAAGTSESGESKKSNPDRVRVFSGKTGKPILHIEDLRGMFPVRGVQIAAAGDLDGDGKGDLFIGSPCQKRTLRWNVLGAVRAYSGANGKELWSKSGDSDEECFGVTIVALADLDGDGCREVAAAGGFDGDVATSAKKSRIEVLSGKSGKVLRTLRPPEAGELFILTVGNIATTPDGDGDGKPDIAIASGHPSGSGGGPWKERVRIYSSGTGKLLLTLERPPTTK